MVNGTSVPALMDSGASRSFISDRLQCRPPLHFVGAYSALELANGETIVSTGIAPRVLVCIGTTPCRLSLTAVPMMEGVQLILGKDWLDIMNPLVDWRSNTLYLRNGSQFGACERHQGRCWQTVYRLSTEDFPVSSTILESSRLGELSPTDEIWRTRLAELSSPQFWQYNPSAKEWATDPASHSWPDHRRGRSMSPRGGVKTRKFFQSQQQDPKNLRIPQGAGRQGTKKSCRKMRPAACAYQKMDIISMRQAAKRG